MRSQRGKEIPVVGLALAAVVLASLGAWFVLSGPASVTSRPNVILISIDTCRADRLSCYGFPRKTTPNIDRLAREGTLFQNVISPVPMTLPAHASMLTGTNPPYHGVHHNLAYRLRPSNITLAEQLKDHGYDTAAVIGAFVLDPQFGLAQGFDFYDAQMPGQDRADLQAGEALNERPADQVTNAALAWLDARSSRRDRPFFLFVHYYDPHHPYEPPKPFAKAYANDKYAGEIAYVDQEVGRLIDRLKDSDLYDSAMVIVAGDHGEALDDHGEREHGYFIYHSTIKVPLVVKWPDRDVAARVEDVVGLVDLVPTILSRVGAALPAELHGEDLARFVSGEPAASSPRFFYSESLAATQYGCTSLLGLETVKFKYIQSSKPELYDVSVDRRQVNNVIAKYPDEARRLQGRLRALLDAQTRILDDEAMAGLDAEAIARLESLGYVGGKLDESFEFDTDAEAPVDFLGFYELINQANYLLLKRRYAEVRSLCESILAERPDVGRAHEMLGRVAFEQGRLPDAADHYGELARLQPGNAEAYNALGNVHVRMRHLDESIAYYRQAIRVATGLEGGAETLERALVRFARVNPVAFQAGMNLANVLFHARRFSEAADAYRRLLEMNPLMEGDAKRRHTFATANYKLGLVLSQLGRNDEAIAALEEALRVKPDYEDAQLARETIRAGRPVFLPP